DRATGGDPRRRGGSRDGAGERGRDAAGDRRGAPAAAAASNRVGPQLRRRPLHSRPSPAGVTRGSIAFGHTRGRGGGVDCRLEAIEPGNDGRGAPPSRPWPTWAVITCRSRVNPRSVAYSAASSFSPPSSPARIFSAMRPAFCRIAVSILAAMSGLALRKAL